MRQFFSIFFQTLLYLFLTMVVLAVGVLLGLQIPAVQTRLAQEVARRVSDKLLFPVSIDGVSIKWFDSLTLEGVRIQDRQGRPMITVGRLDADYNLRNLIDSSAHNLHLDEVVLYRPDVRMIKNPKTGDTNLDEFIARIGELTSDPTKPSVADQNVPFTVARVTLAEGSYTLEDPREPRMRDTKRFDYNHFTLQNLNASIRNLLVLGDTIALDVNDLSGMDRDSRLKIRQLDTDFLYCSTKMKLAKLYAHIGNSVIRHELTFFYDQPSAFGDFNRRVVMRAVLRDSEVRSKDLGYFSDYLRNLSETWVLSGIFTGTVNEFRLRKTDLRFGTNGRSRLTGDMAWKGLPDIDKTTVDFAFTPSVVTMADVRQYYPDAAFNRTVQKLGTVAFNVTFAGAFDEFRIKGQFRTDIGTVAGDLALKWADQPDQTTYAANLRGDNIDLGQLIDQPDQFGKIDGEGRIVGRGTDLARASVDVNGRLGRFGWQGYDYRAVTLEGNLQKAFFHGHVDLRDPNLAFALDGEFDLRGPRNRFDLRGPVQRADLRALGYMSDSLAVRANVDIQLEGNKLDDLVGNAYFRHATVSLNGRDLSIDTLSIVSSIEQRTGAPDSSVRADFVGTQRYFSLDSDFLTARLQGSFQPRRTVIDLTRLTREYGLFFAGDAAGMKTYYELKRQRTALPMSQYGVDYQFIAKDVNPLLTFLNSSVYVAPRTQVEGRFTANGTQFLTATVKTDSMRFGTLGFGPSDLDLTTSKLTNGEAVLASAILSSQRQVLSSLVPTRNLQAEASWDVDHIMFTSSIEQTNSPNRADLNGELSFKGDAIDLTFRRSDLRVLDGDWVLNPQSLIRKVGDEFTIRNLSVVNQDQVIVASGKLSPDSVQRLNVEARNFRLESLNPVLSTSLGGTLNGRLSVRDVYQTPIVESELLVRDLSYQKTLIGNVRGRGEWDQTTQRLNVDANVNRNGADILTLTGNYIPQQKTNSLALKATLNNADLNTLEPFTTGLFSNLGGTAVGTVAISGTPPAPVLTGEVAVRGGRGRFDYLKADFTFDDKVYFGENEIITRRLTLRDPEGNTAQLRGGVYHDGFRYFTMGFDADFKNFRILNTTAKDNDLFYGQAVVTGKAELYGPVDNLVIRANVASNKGTRIYIPLDGATSVGADDKIRFVSRNARPVQARLTNQTTVATDPDTKPGLARSEIDLSRIQMDFNFDITPDAYCEIQLDRQTGDIIKAYGQGRLGMKVDTKGDFTMTGNYEILKGDYTFTFQNIINKRFQIQPNSRITWTGDPYGALLDVTAAYTQYTSLAPLLAYNSTPNASRNADQTRRYPVNLLIKLNGDLGSPSINYDLDVKEYPSSSDFRQAVTAFEARIQSNEQELTRQVSSVLLFNQLLPEGTGLFEQGQVNTGVANSVSELLSNQISRLASNLSENLDVGVSIGGFTGNIQYENLLNNLQLRFSYRLLNDRLRISRDGGFTYGQSQTNAASLLGEWTLEYFITPDGRLRAKVYNRNQQSVLSQNSLNSTISTGGGLSFLYTRSFNRLFGNKRNIPGLLPAPPVEEPKAVPASVTTVSNRGTL